MKVGELFVDLGISGSEKAVRAVESVHTGLSKTAEMGIEAKAAIVGAVYALERMFAISGATGTGLTNFNALLGVSTKTLQQYQFAARQMGVANEDVSSTFRGLQSVMTKTLTGEGLPKYAALVSRTLGNQSLLDPLTYQKAPELLIQKLQEYAQKEKNTGLRNEVLKSFGISDAMIAAMARGGFNQKAFSHAPTYSDREIESLNRANVAWANLGVKIEMAVGHFNAKHGGQLVKDISQLTGQVLKLADALTSLSEKLKVFQVIGKVFEGWNLIIDNFTKNVDNTAEKGFLGEGKDVAKNLFSAWKESAADWYKQMTDDSPLTLIPHRIAPAGTPGAGQSSTHTANVNLNQHFYGPANPREVGDHAQRGVKQAVRQNPAGLQSS